MRMPSAEWQSRPGLPKLLAALDAKDGATRFVGGCVRDTLLGLPVSDVDLATRIDPPETMRRLGKAGIQAVPTGLAHGTVTAVLSSGPIEVTTLRRDVATDGRHALVAFTDDWREDAARRDFTINALSADPTSLAVHDYFGGEADLAERIVRFIGDPYTRIAEDHLRILRFFRFHARFGRAEPDPAGLEACAARANDLMALSRERIADELLKLLALPDPVATVALMVERGVLAPVLPEIGREGVSELRSLIAAERRFGIDPHPLRRLAALLPPDPNLAASLATRLRLSNRAVKRLASAADRRIEAPTRLAYRVGRDEAVDRLLLAGQDPRPLGSWERPRFPLTGGDLIGLGLAPGPAVAKTLQALEQAWIDRDFAEDEPALRQRARSAIAPSLDGGR